VRGARIVADVSIQCGHVLNEARERKLSSEIQDISIAYKRQKALVAACLSFGAEKHDFATVKVSQLHYQVGKTVKRPRFRIDTAPATQPHAPALRYAFDKILARGGDRKAVNGL
jgi:hypothetical protein